MHLPWGFSFHFASDRDGRTECTIRQRAPVHGAPFAPGWVNIATDVDMAATEGMRAILGAAACHKGVHLGTVASRVHGETCGVVVYFRAHETAFAGALHFVFRWDGRKGGKSEAPIVFLKEPFVFVAL